MRKDLRRLASSLDPQALGVLCLGLRSPRLSPSRVARVHRREPDLVPDRAHALRVLLELERAGLVVWTPARRDELPEQHYLLTRRGRRLARWLVTPSREAPAAEHRAAAGTGSNTRPGAVASGVAVGGESVSAIARKGARRMRRKDRRPEAAPPQEESTRPTKPQWQEFLDPQERPSRQDLAAGHDVFTDSILEAVPLPRWLRGRRRPPRDKLS